jgi:serine/threonine protein kinase
MTPSPRPLQRDALPVGTVLNGYRVLGVLGRGGFGITYQASDLLDQLFAIKEFFPRQFAMRTGSEVVVTSDADEGIFVDCRKRFLTEARLLAALGRQGGTPGVVQVVTFFEANNTAYSVMELLTGETLDDLLRAKGQSLAPEVLVPLLKGILTPLARVHAAGFLHRDIKPSNILIRPDSQPVLIDFGSARDMGPSSNTTYTQVYSGNYAPIEQMLHGAPQGPYSDIYSVGGVGYRAIGGSLVDARARQQAALTHAPDPLVPAADVGRGRYPGALLYAIDRALAVTASERPQRVEEMLALLERSFDTEPTVRRGKPPVENEAREGFAAASRGFPRGAIRNPALSSRVGAFSDPDRVSALWRRLPGLRNATTRQGQRSGTNLQRPHQARVAIPIIVVIAAAAIGISSYLWFYEPGQPASALAELKVAVERNGNDIAVKFPATTDTAMLMRALPHLINLNVKSIDLSNSQVSTLPSLQGLASLEELNLRGSQVASLLSLDGLTALRRLDLAKTKLASLPPLQDLTSLQALDLSDTRLTTLPSLDALTALQDLNLANTNIAGLPSLTRLAALRRLNLQNTNVVNLPQMAGLSELQIIPSRPRAPLEAGAGPDKAAVVPSSPNPSAVTAPAPLPEEVPPPPAVASTPPGSLATSTSSPPGSSGSAAPSALAPPAHTSLQPPPQTRAALPHAPNVKSAVSPPKEPPVPPAKSQQLALTAPPVVPQPAKTQPSPAAAAVPPAAETAPRSHPQSDSVAMLSGQEFFQRGYSASQLQNYAEAKKYYLLGADKGNADCMYWLGLLYAGGLGVQPDYGLAQTWYQKSADHGYKEALYGIGLLYLQGGPGVRRDCDAARRWFETAASRGSSSAQNWLKANRSCS